MDLDTTQLLKNIERDPVANKYFKGVFSRDLLPRKLSYPASFIANTKSSKSRGEHWIAFYIDADKNLEFFDPMGLPPSYYRLVSYISQISNRNKYNTTQYQSLFSPFCGYYCLLFVFLKSRNKTFNSKIFNINFEENDKFLKKLIKKGFFY